MKKLVVIGELIVDFFSNDGHVYTKHPGGAPANVAACYSMLGGNSYLCSRVGNDSLGTFLIDCLKEKNINTDYVSIDDEYNTGIAFVTNQENGDRSFSFIRKNAADLFFDYDNLPDILSKGDCLHFGSVDLVTINNQIAHKEFIKKAIQSEAFVSFDVNLRFNLWESKEELRRVVREFLPLAHIIKCSEEEKDFLFNENEDLFKGRNQIFIVTKGSNGSILYTKSFSCAVPAISTNVVDTTGAGDAFIGAFLYNFQNTSSNDLANSDYESFLRFSSYVSKIVVSKQGALNAMPSMNTVLMEIDKDKK